jgi:hypothetical protein
MAGMFYSLQESAEKLNKTEKEIKQMVKDGLLREFRDGSNLLFKVEEVEALMPDTTAPELEEIPEIEPLESEEPMLEEISSDSQEPEISEQEIAEAELRESEAPEPETAEPEAPEMETAKPELIESEEQETEIPEEVEVSEPEALEPEVMEEAPESEITEEAPETELMAEDTFVAEPPPPPTGEASGSSEILLAPETGAPVMPGDLTDADTALTGQGTSVLGETDRDYEITGDTMAETSVSAGLTGSTPEVPLEEIEEDVNLDSFGSGSGLLDLSLQADDTSLGGILDEIYTAEGEGKEPAAGIEPGSEAAMPAEPEETVPEEELAAPIPAAAEVPALAQPLIEMAPDTQSNTLGMLLFLPLLIVIYTTTVVVAGLKGVMPSILASVQSFIWYIMGGAAVVSGIVVAAAFLMTGEKGTKVKKPKKPKVPKPKKEKIKKEKPKKEPKPKKEKKAKKAK